MRCCALVALMMLLSSPRSASGEPEDEATLRAQALFKKAQVHFSLKEFGRALELNKEAYRIKQLPDLLFNIGQCHRYLGNCKDAVFYFREYLEKRPDTPHKTNVKKMIGECEVERPASAPSAKLEPTSTPTPTPTPKPKATPEPTPKPQPRPEAPSRVLIWTGLATAVVLLSTSAITAAVVHDKNTEYLAPSTSIEQRQELRESGRPLAYTSVVTLALGAACAVATGVYYWFFYRSRPEATVGVAPLEPGGAALWLRADL